MSSKRKNLAVKKTKKNIAEKKVVKIKNIKKKDIKKKNIRKKVINSSNKINKTTFSESAPKIKITVFGIGGGGSSIISEIAPDFKRINFVAANTDKGALSKVSKKIKRFQFGEKITKGFGTGMDFELGKAAAIADKEKIKKIIEGQDVCVFVVSLGGGAGSGGILTFAKIAKEVGCLSYGIFTLPFNFEGSKKMEIAKQAIEEVKSYLNVITILPNENIFKVINKETPLKNALSMVNKNLSKNLSGLIRTISNSGLINIDFADFKTIMDGRGKIAYLNVANIDPSKDKNDNFVNLISSPFCSYNIKGAGGVLLNIIGGKEIGMRFVSDVSKVVSGLCKRNAKLVLGISHNKSSKNKNEVVLFAVGCEYDFLKKNSSKSKKASGNLENKIESEVKITPLSKEKNEEKNEKKNEKKQKEKLKKKIKKKPTKKNLSIPKNILEKKKTNIRKQEKANIKVRRNAIEIKKEMEEAEKEILEQERKWETPAFLRREAKNDT